MPGADRAATKEDDMAGDNGGGDIISISGNISGSGIAVGRGAKARVTTGPSAAEINALFAQLVEAARSAPAADRDEAVRTTEALKAEVVKGDGIDDSRMARLLDRLVDLVPGAVGAVTSLFATPILAALAGPTTKFVLEKIRGD
jgi:hypothetical protein